MLENFKKLANSFLHLSNSHQITTQGNLQHGPDLLSGSGTHIEQWNWWREEKKQKAAEKKKGLDETQLVC